MSKEWYRYHQNYEIEAQKGKRWTWGRFAPYFAEEIKETDIKNKEKVSVLVLGVACDQTASEIINFCRDQFKKSTIFFLDLSPYPLESIKENLKTTGKNPCSFSFVQADIKHLPFCVQSIDFITSDRVLLYLPWEDRPKAIRDASALLKGKGSLAMTLTLGNKFTQGISLIDSKIEPKQSFVKRLTNDNRIGNFEIKPISREGRLGKVKDFFASRYLITLSNR